MEVVLFEPIPQYWSVYGSCTVWAYPLVLISLWTLYCTSLSLSIDQFMEVVLYKHIPQYWSVCGSFFTVQAYPSVLISLWKLYCMSLSFSIDQFMEVVLYEPIPQYWSLYGSCTVWAYPSVLISHKLNKSAWILPTSQSLGFRYPP